MKKRQAIRECKKVWRLVLEGKAKGKFEALEIYPEFKEYTKMCPFCEYVEQYRHKFPNIDANPCWICPLVEQTGWSCIDWKINYRYSPEYFASIIMALKE